jgi:hypothetical protein
MTAHPRQQRDVVHDGALRVLQRQPLSEAEREQALAQHVLHRLPEPQIHAQRQRRDQLG